MGAARSSAPCYVVAILLTLPPGAVAVVLIYGGYAVLKEVGGLWAARTTSDGSDASWLSTGSAVLNVTVLVVAATANAVLLELLARRREMARDRAERQRLDL
jgi:hypothetical protein